MDFYEILIRQLQHLGGKILITQWPGSYEHWLVNGKVLIIYKIPKSEDVEVFVPVDITNKASGIIQSINNYINNTLYIITP